MKKGYILRAVSGELTCDSFLRIFDDIVFSSSIFQEENIICDLSEAMFPVGSMSELLDIAIGMDKYRLVLKCKIAHVAGGNGTQMRIARNLATVLAFKGFDYKVFTDMEEARRWVAGKPLAGQQQTV